MTQKTELQAEDESNTGCGPGCSCGSKDSKKPLKTTVFLVVVLVAAFFIVRGFISDAEAGQGSDEAGFAAASRLAAGAGTQAGTQSNTSNTGAQPQGWGEPLASISDLNALAVNASAVFILLPAGDDESIETIKQEVQAATATLISDGTPTLFFALSVDSPDYVSLNSQTAFPCVLAMVKGAGLSIVTSEITEQKLLEAMVAASRPSACAPSGCGPSGCP